MLFKKGFFYLIFFIIILCNHTELRAQITLINEEFGIKIYSLNNFDTITIDYIKDYPKCKMKLFIENWNGDSKFELFDYNGSLKLTGQFSGGKDTLRKFSQTAKEKDSKLKYSNTLNQLHQVLLQNDSFKEAVFIVENAYDEDSLLQVKNSNEVKFLAMLCRGYLKTIYGNQYRWVDTENHLLNQSIFSILSDTVSISTDSGTVVYLPLQYSFADPLGKQDWSNMFVTKLLATHEGQLPLSCIPLQDISG